ncbi:MAG: 16S rRNA (cytidine(1402)-2'-O)-methyltransferase [Dehalogenimonas sp.]|uniref:Ribosomal RNA small subunit methyltransferase I n=1 Tax=Candidatus Dehalogenimonas loeffleri TaxID=3127115 RepID=A0ABZ2J4J3_9CHLR|nr:16S rRNA (cytidine(1402)-2'-O)-methyltransferase [Dehalogenimonas sp.]
MPTLYVVATPIGNLEDITFRAVRVLKEVSLIAAEDTRHTRKLLNALDIRTPMTSYFEHNKLSKLDFILDRLSEADVALVSDAGTPGIADPGFELIAAAIDHGVKVEVIPGPSSVATAVALSGLPAGEFRFSAFLPRKAADRRQALQKLTAESAALVFFEAPHRVTKTLAALLEILGDRRTAVCRELTKLHEEVFRGTLSAALEHFAEPRGEFVIVVEGAKNIKAAPVADDEVADRLKALKSAGLPAKEATATVAADTGLSRRELYRAWLKLK